MKGTYIIWDAAGNETRVPNLIMERRKRHSGGYLPQRGGQAQDLERQRAAADGDRRGPMSR